MLTLAKQAQVTPSKLVNKKSKAYKEAGIDTDSMSDNDLAEFLTENPKAIKRPIITDEHTAVIGFKENDIKELFSI